jgi:anhydro-N-acetylmuramic acid kinase
MRHPFLKRRPPKTTGREQFGAAFVGGQLPLLRRSSADPCDWIATATAFTACSIARAYHRFLPGFAPPPARKSLSTPAPAGAPARSARVQLILCGGGAKNATLVCMLAAELPGVAFIPMRDLGVSEQEKEACSFALLAAACVDRAAANLPQVTGARRPAVLGRLVPPPPTRGSSADRT